MKKRIGIMLCLLVLALVGCGRKAPVPQETTAVPETTIPTVPTEPTETEPPVPETITAAVLADRTEVVLKVLNRGDTVAVAGEYDAGHYVIKMENGYGLIEKRLLRMDGEAAPEEWTGYARWNTQFYTDYHQKSATAEKLATNTKLTVLDTFEGLCVVSKQDGTIGYVPESSISRNPIRSKPSGGGGGGGGTTSGDGGDIVLSHRSGITLLGTFVPQSGTVTGNASVLVDKAQILLGWYDREETARIVTETGFAPDMEGFHTVYLEGLYGYIRRDLLRKDGEEAYTLWEGYARYGTQLFDNYYLSGEALRKLSTNTKVQVLCELDGCCMVQVGEDVGYLDLSQISANPIRSKPSGGGGSSGGGAEWSPPML